MSDPRAALNASGQTPDVELDIAGVASQFAQIDAPDRDWRVAGTHLSELARNAVDLSSLF
jgi:anti-sigma regulatory factor (Ser/Thr protein kinase)